MTHSRFHHVEQSLHNDVAAGGVLVLDSPHDLPDRLLKNGVESLELGEKSYFEKEGGRTNESAFENSSSKENKRYSSFHVLLDAGQPADGLPDACESFLNVVTPAFEAKFGEISPDAIQFGRGEGFWSDGVSDEESCSGELEIA